MSDNISNFTNKDIYSKALNALGSDSGKILNVNGSKVPIAGGGKTLFDGAQASVSSFDKTLNLSKYIAPTTLTLDTINRMGTDIDRVLESSFLLQTLRIKATDVMCSAFCFLISLMSCEDRTNLYNALNNATKASQAVNSGIRAANELVKTTGAALASVDTLMSSTSSLFNKKGNNEPSKVEALSTLAATPASIIDNAKTIANALKLGLNFKFMMPNALGRSIWDLAQAVLSQLQCQAVQMSDEALSKLIKPVEDMLKRITPSICYGNMSARLQNSILDTLNRFKSMILNEIGDLFTSNFDFTMKMSQFNLRSATALELMAFSQALLNLSAHFLEAARACGVSPCKNSPDAKSLDDIGNIHNIYDPEYNPLKSSASAPAYFPKLQQAPKLTSNIEELSRKLAPSLGLPQDGKTYVTPEQVMSIYQIDNAPKKIADLINNGALDNILDNNYSVYRPNHNTVKIVYAYNKNCGDK